MACGKAVPRSLSEAYREKTGMPILHAWGMTETSPLGSVCRIRSTLRYRSEDELADGGFIKIVDRTKDLVKSGGEWISSVELENAVMAHPDVMEAAVVAVPDDKWGERPCACVVPCEGEELDADELRSYLSDRVAKWWIPDRIEFIDEVPKTSVGKFSKKTLRERFSA